MKNQAMKSLITLSVLSALSIASSPVLANQSETNNEAPNSAEKSKNIEHIQIIGRDNKLRKESGSATLLDELILEKYEYDDIHRVLANVPGVNIRQEDGYGLRPNIGFRGVTPERSKKINILEDGVLIGPAPYSAPAAYYFPTVARMTSVEVVKGPAAIKFGPNTVAGTLNMTTRAVPDSFEGQVEVGLGSNGYKKLHGHVGNSVSLDSGNLGFVIEALHTQADGFKDVDFVENSLFEKDTGFDKNDVMAKVVFDHQISLFNTNLEQSFELKLAAADEVSNETYMGLTDTDFKESPYRRYAASQVGNMDWDHEQVQFTHRLSNDSFNVTTRLYNNTFERAWRKVNGFNQIGNGAIDRTLQEIVANPNTEVNQNYYQVLTGQKNSEEIYEQIVVGTNDRSYYSKGLQSDLKLSFELAGFENLISTGIRFHKDRIDRDHFEQNYLMLDSVMTPDQIGTKFTTVDYEETEAVSIYLADTIQIDDLNITIGGRGEIIDSRYQNEAEGKNTDWQEKESKTWLYSASAFYTLTSELGIFGGVHEGFVPTSPKQNAEIKPESSVNYELGLRYNDQKTQLETVLFFNDFDNLKESCSFSTSASCTNTAKLDQEYNGGEVDVTGLEFNLQRRETLTSELDLPWSVTYTRTHSEFKSDFASDFELWGDVTAGDSVPYLPEDQLTVNLGLESNDWQLNLLVKYVGSMPEAAGDNVALSGLETDSYTVIDLSANYYINANHTVYFKVDNITDKVALVSRRPFGARPSKPQQAFVGYKYNF
ncbi:TonB-dependent receptor [Psychrosphaera haliotis]|uniref:TonB-dependent receptor family protein n=1 Tax=Psychrosphaera haliotis TaxID=555083 RepID=UPI0031D80DE6